MELRGLRDPNSDRYPAAMLVVHFTDAPEFDMQKPAVAEVLDDVETQCEKVQSGLNDSAGGSAQIEEACRALLSFQVGLAQLARAIKFEIAGLKDPGPRPISMQ